MDAFFWAYPLLGIFVGFLAGLLGIGGGLIIVPVLSLIFTQLAFPPELVFKLALGSAMLSIVGTSIASALTHAKHRNVHWPAVVYLLPGIAMGALLGSLLVGSIDKHILVGIFALFSAYGGIKMLTSSTKRDPENALIPTLSLLKTSSAGICIGTLSSLVSAGGGFLTVPFLSACQVPIERAIGSAATNAVPLSLFATLGFLLGEPEITTLPLHSQGFVYLPAAIGIMATSTLSSPLGAWATQKLPKAFIQRCFGGLLLLLSAEMSWRIFL